MWLIMLQQERTDEFVIATGQSRTVRDFLDEAFGYLDLDWHAHVEIDPRYFRPSEVDELRGDMTRRRSACSAVSRRCSSATWLGMMVDANLADVRENGEPTW